jgi:hypothetical protein
VQIITFPKTRKPPVAYPVQSVDLVKAFLVIRGRNAWHGEWSNRYSLFGLHPTLALAKKYCESQRRQGSGFTIRELPAVALSDGFSLLLVTECTNREVFADFDTASFCRLCDALPVASVTLPQWQHILRHESLIWGDPLRQRRGTIVMRTAEQTAKDIPATEPVQADVRLFSYVSSPKGSNRPLSWELRVSDTTFEASRRIADLIAEHANPSRRRMPRWIYRHIS